METISMQHQISTQKGTQRGFSLIEVLVSLSIFAVVMTMAVGSLMVLITSNSKAQNTQAIMTNMSYALDSMTREIRTGSDYFCDFDTALPNNGEASQDCAAGKNAFTFNEGGVSLTEFTSSHRIGYRLHNAAIERRLGNGVWLPITAPEITITTLRFYVTGSTRSDLESPTVTLYVAGTAGPNDGGQAGFNVQTTVVQQLLDI